LLSDVVVGLQESAGKLAERLLELDELLMVLEGLGASGVTSSTTPLSSDRRTRVSSMSKSPARRIDLNDDEKASLCKLHVSESTANYGRQTNTNKHNVSETKASAVISDKHATV